MQAYSRWIEPGMYPFVILFLDIDSKLVDVNVHPRKEEVKFLDPGSIYNLVFNVIKENLEQKKGLETKTMKVSFPSEKKIKINNFGKTADLILQQPQKENKLELDFNQNFFNISESKQFEDIKII